MNHQEKVYIGSDHAGFELKNSLHKFLEEEGYDAVDLGCFSTDTCDYPDIAREVAEKVRENHGARGILICGSGIGVAIAANKLSGIRATVAVDEQMAEMARAHNDINILTLGATRTDFSAAQKIALKFLRTPFDNIGRRVRRVEKIAQLDKGLMKEANYEGNHGDGDDES